MRQFFSSRLDAPKIEAVPSVAAIVSNIIRNPRLITKPYYQNFHHGPLESNDCLGVILKLVETMSIDGPQVGNVVCLIRPIERGHNDGHWQPTAR